MKDLLKVKVLFAMCVGIAGCLLSSSNIVVDHVSNSEYTATLSRRNTGAMSKGSTLVSLRLNSVPDNDTHGLIVLDVFGAEPVEMKWTGLHNLALSCTSCTPQDVNGEVVKAGDVTINYDENLHVR